MRTGVLTSPITPKMLAAIIAFPAALLSSAASASNSAAWSSSPATVRKLIRVLDDDFPRTETADLLRSPVLRFETVFDDEIPVPADEWDLWSRQAGLRGGRQDWTERLPGWARRTEEKFEANPDPEREQDRADRQRRRRALRRRIDETVWPGSGRGDRAAKR